MQIKKQIPNLLTCGNLLLGVLAIIEILQGQLEYIIYYTLLAGLLDFFDGFAARMLKVSSPIGKDLDSLADMISFGTVPALLVFQMLSQQGDFGIWNKVPLIIVILSGVRLAKFNNDTRQTEHFYGLPTPANALFFCSLPLLIQHPLFASWIGNPTVLISLSVAMALLLVTDVRLIALKFKSFARKGNEEKLLLVLGSLVLLATFQLMALPFMVLYYIVLSLIVNILDPNN